MATFSLENFGCRATEADAAAMRRVLRSAGWTMLDQHASADVVVLNTCTVTSAADSQARDAVRKIHRANPTARILVTGCYAQRAPEDVAQLPGVAWVVGNSHQTEIPRLLSELCAPDAETLSAAGSAADFRHQSEDSAPVRDFVPLATLDTEPMSLARGPAKILTGDIFAQTVMQASPLEDSARVPADRTRPILKIQDGCNNRCSYCVIPFVRGLSRSLPPNEVLEETRKLVAAGAKEIVLSGINLGAYGRDLSPRVELADLVRRVLDQTELEQLRFSSIEPQDITEDFVSARRSIAAHCSAFSCAAAIRIGPYSPRDASLVPRSALRRTRSADSHCAARRGHWRGRDRRLSRRDRRRFRRYLRFHYAPAVHLSTCVLVFSSARHESGGSRRTRFARSHS